MRKMSLRSNAIAVVICFTIPACSNVSSDEIQPETAPIETQTQANSNEALSQPRTEDAMMREAPVASEPAQSPVAPDDLVPGLNSPGEGPPPRGALPKNITQDVSGHWGAIAERGGVTISFFLDPISGAATGNVTNLEGWPSDTERPARWIYLAMGQLVLTTEEGAIVWGGEVEDEDTIRQTRSVGVDLVAIKRQK